MLKDDKYKDLLASMALQPVLDTLPWGVDIPLCAEFLSYYDKKVRVGTFTAPDQTKKVVHITEKVVAEALGLQVKKW